VKTGSRLAREIVITIGEPPRKFLSLLAAARRRRSPTPRSASRFFSPRETGDDSPSPPPPPPPRGNPRERGLRADRISLKFSDGRPGRERGGGRGRADEGSFLNIHYPAQFAGTFAVRNQMGGERTGPNAIFRDTTAPAEVF